MAAWLKSVSDVTAENFLDVVKGLQVIWKLKHLTWSSPSAFNGLHILFARTSLGESEEELDEAAGEDDDDTCSMMSFNTAVSSSSSVGSGSRWRFIPLNGTLVGRTFARNGFTDDCVKRVDAKYSELLDTVRKMTEGEMSLPGERPCPLRHLLVDTALCTALQRCWSGVRASCRRSLPL